MATQRLQNERCEKKTSRGFLFYLNFEGVVPRDVAFLIGVGGRLKGHDVLHVLPADPRLTVPYFAIRIFRLFFS